MFNKEIGTRIRKQRELLGYTREELAERINVSSKFCSDIEIGAKGMSIDTLCKLSKELLLTTDYILFGKQAGNVDEEFFSLLSNCNKENITYLKNIIRNFIKACNNLLLIS